MLAALFCSFTNGGKREGESLEERRKGRGRKGGDGGREGGRKVEREREGVGVKYHHNENTNENM